MTADEQGHEGWSNYETWAVNLWLTNETSTYNYARCLASEQTLVAGNDPNVQNGIWTHNEAKRYRTADALKDYVTDGLLPNLGATLAADLLNAAVSKVDWSEIAENLLS